MRIEEVSVENYKSLRSVRLSELGALVTLIGKNGSGKSNLLEFLARFFADIDIAGVPQGIDQYAWFDANQDLSIVGSVVVKLEPSEFWDLWPAEISEVLKNGKKSDLNVVRIVRTLDKPPSGWQSRELSLGGVVVSQQGQFLTNALTQAVGKEPVQAEAWHFDPVSKKEAPTGTRVVVVPSQRVSYTMGTFSDGLVKTDQLGLRAIQLANHSWQDYLKSEGIAQPAGEFTPAQLQALSGPIRSDHVQTFLTRLNALLKGKFRLVMAARDTPSQGSAVRVSYLDQDTQTYVRNVGQSEARPDQRKWSQIRDSFSEITDGHLELHPSYVAMSREDLRLPIQYAGGGHQTLVTLLRHLYDSVPFLAFEEPEAHMHPELVRDFFSAVRDASESKQVFLTTHSPILLDQSSPSTSWLCRRKGVESTFQRVDHREELSTVLRELGSRPSDFLFANAILFVEGSSDRAFLLGCARAMKSFLRTEQVTVIPINGKGSGNYHLSVWSDAAKGVGIPFFMILDKGADAEAKKYERAGDLRRGRNLFVLKKGDIEDYYPESLLATSIEELFGERLSKEELESLLTAEGRADTLEAALKRMGKLSRGWKLRIAENIAQRITVDQVDGEIKTIVESIDQSLR